MFGQAETDSAASGDIPFKPGLTLFAGSVDCAEEAEVVDGPEVGTERRWIRCAVLKAGAADGHTERAYVAGELD